MRKRLFVIIVLLLPTLSWASPEPRGPAARLQSAQAQSQQKTITRKEAIEQAQNRQSGRVLSAELSRDGQHPVYKVKMLTPDGRVKTLNINAEKN